MLKKFALLSLLSVALGNVAHAQVIFEETFESYSDYNELLAAWPSSNPARPDNATRLIEGDTLGDEDGPYYGGTNLTKFAQFCGSANDATGIGNCDLATDNAGVAGGGTVNLMNLAEQVNPTATKNVKFSMDIGDDAFSANKRYSVGLRSTTPTAENLIELGFYNGPGTTAHFSYRAILFGSGGVVSEDPVNFAGWSNFARDDIDSPLADTSDTPSEVGRGFHRYSAEISLTDIRFELDLFADGLTNDPLDPQPGVGVAGIDAFDIVAASLTANGFDQLRFGTPSAIASSGGTNILAAFVAFDNIKLEYVDVATPTVNADFDGDGDVDGRDFLIWQRTGLIDDGTATQPDGDANGDGFVNTVDLEAWGNAYNNGALAGISAVPEPTSAALLGLALSSLVLMKRR
jgi:hypothetical protein